MVNWVDIKSKLDEAATSARQEVSINSAMNVYNAKIVEALQLAFSTASVNGVGVVNGGVCSPSGPIAGGNVVNALIS